MTLFPYPWLNMLITVLWIAGVTSACNSLDHVDGATAGTSAISAFFIFLIAWYAPEPQRWLSFVAVAVLGASLGFLLYNFNPAKIYLGDNGAFFLGYTLAAMAILGGWSEKPVEAFLIPGLLMAAPIFDIVLSTILRYKNNVVRTFPEAILYCGRDHTTHRMMAHGLSKNVAVYVLYAINVMGGLVALSGLALGTEGFLALVLLFFLGLFALGKWLDECPKSKLYDS
jgi:UDP-GlcNAc:undecaprenyl-phosphate GlcNAc-1-phosphate transferase